MDDIIKMSRTIDKLYHHGMPCGYYYSKGTSCKMPEEMINVELCIICARICWTMMNYYRFHSIMITDLKWNPYHSGGLFMVNNIFNLWFYNYGLSSTYYSAPLFKIWKGSS